MFRRLLLAAAACAFAPFGAALAQPSAEQAQVLDRQLRSWVKNTLGLTPAFLNDLAFKVVPEGDHYRISVRLDAIPAVAGAEGGEMAIAAQELPQGRWLLYDYRFPSPFRLHLGLSAAGAGAAGPADFRIGFGKLRWDAIFDPSFATPSVSNSRSEAYELHVNAPTGRQTARAGAISSQVSLIPKDNARIDVLDRAWAGEFSIVVNGPDQQQAGAALIGRLDVGAAITGLDRDRFWPTLRSILQASANAQAAGANNQQDRAALRDLYSRLRGMVTGGEFEETAEDLRAEGGGHVVDFGRITIGAGIETPNDTLAAHLTFALDGLAAPDIPAEARAFVPDHVLVRQSVSGIDLGDLDALIMAATAPGVEPKLEQPEIAERVKALFAHGGITATLGALEVDLGPTRFRANGKLTALSPEHFTSQGRVSVTGFNALIEKVKASPQWAKAVPFLQLAARLGHTERDRIEWPFTTDNADVTVNGIDISALIRASKELEKH